MTHSFDPIINNSQYCMIQFDQESSGSKSLCTIKLISQHVTCVAVGLMEASG